MTKNELIAELANSAGVTKKHAEFMLTNLTNIIQKHVGSGEKVSITGFGTFDRGLRKARAGINPITKEKIKIPAIPTPRFRAGTRFKSSVR